jgi:ubiquinone/menaquinone biosynthesis C-methylase UbiE
MKINEHEYYSKVANWSFEDIKYITENHTDWIYEEEIKKHINANSKVLDLGTAAGEKVLKRFPDGAEILGTDYSTEMIKNANKNLLKSKRKNITFRVMDNLKMDTPDNYFDVVTARHTVIDPKQIYKTLKKGGFPFPRIRE